MSSNENKQYGQKLFGIHPDATDEDQESEDIEAAIEKELAAMKNRQASPRTARSTFSK